ncbi:MAG TPA: glycerol-3-phosphate 1-O-acyltransferase PlsY, partial [Acholeplasmataceae bacterium]|nr:glycerol-3-phosphate 1-O-acyltransferase PlsY [Acholeplasmataceae bacterium]
MQYFLIVLLLIVSYLLGSIPFGLVIGKVVKKIDIREYGSKNTGATNAVRVLGFKLGVLCFFLDALKGGLIIIIVRILMATNVELGFQLGMIKINENINITITALYGLTAVLGHVFPIFLKFKGGKAVATSVGALLAFAPVIGMLGILVFYITLKMSGYASLGSLMGASTS